MFRLRLVEFPMPTGSTNPDVLLAWLLDSMGLVRRKSESGGIEEGQGALHRIMTEAFLKEPLGRWDAKSLCEVTGLSQTGIHHQLVKLRECGLISSNTDRGWHIHVLRGGSISSAVELVTNEARTVLKLRMKELSGSISLSDERMEVTSPDEIPQFRIMISEPGPISEDDGHLESLARDLGLSGERVRSGDSLASKILMELCTSSDPRTILGLSDMMGETRSRVGRSVDKMRAAGLVQRVPMMNRIAQDIFIGVMRQFDARGEEWLMTRGGLGRINADTSNQLISGAKSKSLSIEKVEGILSDVELDSKKILLNTLGGRMPYGFRISGKDGDMVTENVMRSADRTLRRLKTVSQRLEDAISD